MQPERSAGDMVSPASRPWFSHGVLLGSFRCRQRKFFVLPTAYAKSPLFLLLLLNFLPWRVFLYYSVRITLVRLRPMLHMSTHLRRVQPLSTQLPSGSRSTRLATSWMGPYRTSVRIILPVPLIFVRPFLQPALCISRVWHGEKEKRVCMTLPSRELQGLPSPERDHRTAP